jgi:hypothetical protein
MKTILSFTLFFFVIQLAQAIEKTWQDNKITTNQPFAAQVIGVGSSWVGYDLLLEEIGVDSPRFCFVRIAMTFPIKYIVITKEDASERLTSEPKFFNQIKPPILINDFNYEASGLYKLGKKYGDKDLLIIAIANTKKMENKSQ